MLRRFLLQGLSSLFGFFSHIEVVKRCVNAFLCPCALRGLAETAEITELSPELMRGTGQSVVLLTAFASFD